MNWNHRLMNCPSENGGEDYITFKEVYYDEGKPCSYCNPFMGGDDIGEVRELLVRLGKAVEQPVLHEDEFKGD